MTQLIKHYLLDRDNPSVFATTPEQWAQPMFGVINFTAEGLEKVYTLFDENGIEFFFSTCPDETVIEEKEGLAVLTQAEWDAEIAAYDARQSTKRLNLVRKYRDQLLNQTDWIVIKAKETDTNLSTEFKDWRQSLRDLPSAATFPTELPAPPAGVSVDQSIYTSYIEDLRKVPMINDPLSV
jgi:deoxyribodipyrimidine photolyase